jgi:uncharacterized protein YqgV (UPF0045/DUF77 family)
MGEDLKKMVAVEGAENADDLKCIALGEEDTSEEIAEVEPVTAPAGMEQRLDAFETRLLHITNSIDSLFQIVKSLRDVSSKAHDTRISETIEKKKKEQKIEIPEGTTLHASSKGLSYFCRVGIDGFYVGATRCDSLSAAAEGVSGVRRSGWTFWKMSDGRTVKEVYKDQQV